MKIKGLRNVFTVRRMEFLSSTYMGRHNTLISAVRHAKTLSNKSGHTFQVYKINLDTGQSTSMGSYVEGKKY